VRLDFLIMADKAEAINGKLYMIGGGFDRVTILEPGALPSYDLALGFLVDYNETNEPHDFGVVLMDADNGQVIPPLGGRIEVGRPPGMVAGQEQRVMIVFRGPFPVPAVGSYRWVPILDGDEQQPSRFSVELAAQAGGRPPRGRG
jgi:hypothetical protein